MAYRGNFEFAYEDDFMDDEGCCIVCGSEFFCENADEYDGDGHLYRRGWGEAQKRCDCDGRRLRKELTERDEVYLDGFGSRLLQALREVPGLEHIDEWDVCRLSEAAGKQFEVLLEHSINQLIIWHVEAWSDHMLRLARVGNERKA